MNEILIILCFQIFGLCHIVAEFMSVLLRFFCYSSDQLYS
jgi:hypothetical protein